MTREERKKAIAAAVAQITVNPLVPSELRVGLAAMVEEIAYLRSRQQNFEEAWERVLFGGPRQ